MTFLYVTMIQNRRHVKINIIILDFIVVWTNVDATVLTCDFDSDVFFVCFYFCLGCYFS